MHGKVYLSNRCNQGLCYRIGFLLFDPVLRAAQAPDAVLAQHDSYCVTINFRGSQCYTASP